VAADAGPRGSNESPAAPNRTATSLRKADLPASIAACFDCHRETVESYAQHGMSQSIGSPDGLAPGTVSNPATGMTYRITTGDSGGTLRGSNRSGGERRQRVVGRIGAGNFDISWATEEIDPWTSAPTGRLFFAPVETITGRGHELSPFAQSANSPGLDFPLVEGCLTCHTLTRLETLPSASTAPGRTHVFPGHALGSDAFSHLEALSCDACHGDSARHVEIMEGSVQAAAGDLGIDRVSSLSASLQRDRCARCHLQGDARFELTRSLDLNVPIAAQFPVLVTSAEPDDDFRFVGQLERLAHSECFKQSPTMTCPTCHDPHTGAVSQGIVSFEKACLSCHVELEPHAREALARSSVESITGDPSRTELGCVDCHVRRSQPFDLPHVRTADHFIRREISPPEDSIPHRQFTAPGMGLQLYNDSALSPLLAQEPGKRWLAGVEAMGLLTLGDVEGAAARFARFPAPGTAPARTASSPAPLVPLETSPQFHHLRGLTLMATGEIRSAMAAFSDALGLDPHFAPSRLARAQLRHDLGDLVGALHDTEEVVQLYPEADSPWRLRARMVAQAGRPDFAALALERATELWPSDAGLWRQLAQSAAASNRSDLATEAARRAEELAPGSTTAPNIRPSAPAPSR